MTAWVNIPIYKQFLLQNEIAGDVKNCHQAIDALLTNFNITSQMEMHSWMANFEAKRQQDQDATMHYLGDVKNQGYLSEQAAQARHEEVMWVMTKLQDVCIPSSCSFLDLSDG